MILSAAKLVTALVSTLSEWCLYWYATAAKRMMSWENIVYKHVKHLSNAAPKKLHLTSTQYVPVIMSCKCNKIYFAVFI